MQSRRARRLAGSKSGTQGGSIIDQREADRAGVRKAVPNTRTGLAACRVPVETELDASLRARCRRGHLGRCSARGVRDGSWRSVELRGRKRGPRARTAALSARARAHQRGRKRRSRRDAISSGRANLRATRPDDSARPELLSSAPRYTLASPRNDLPCLAHAAHRRCCLPESRPPGCPH
jgi:hypothetical protein